MTRLRANLLVLAAAATWGFAFYFQKTAMDHVGPILFTGLRTLLAGLALLPVAWLEGRLAGRPWTPALTRYAILAGLLFAAGGIVQQEGMKTATVTNAGFLTALYVVVTPLLTLLVLRRRPPAHVWPAVALALCGVWLLGGGGVSGLSRGDVLIAASTLFWGGMILVIGLAGEGGRPIAFTAMQFAFAAVIALPAAFAFETVDPDAIRAAAPDILFVGILSSALTFSFFAVAVRHTSPSEGVILMSTETLFAALAGALLLGERLAPVGWAGAALMLAATLVVQLGPVLRLRRPSAQG